MPGDSAPHESARVNCVRAFEHPQKSYAVELACNLNLAPIFLKTIFRSLEFWYCDPKLRPARQSRGRARDVPVLAHRFDTK